MKFLGKHWRKFLIRGLLFMLIISIGLVFWSGSEIASPPRRPLMDYHREFLSNQSTHGMHIDSFAASDRTPCIVVTPAGNPEVR